MILLDTGQQRFFRPRAGRQDNHVGGSGDYLLAINLVIQLEIDPALFHLEFKPPDNLAHLSFVRRHRSQPKLSAQMAFFLKELHVMAPFSGY